MKSCVSSGRQRAVSYSISGCSVFNRYSMSSPCEVGCTLACIATSMLVPYSQFHPETELRGRCILLMGVPFFNCGRSVIGREVMCEQVSHKARVDIATHISSGLQLLSSFFPLPLNLLCKSLVLCQLLLKRPPGNVASLGRS